MLVLLILLVACFLLTLCLGAFWFWNAHGTTILRAGQAEGRLSRPPKVSIIVAARNEEPFLPAAIESLLKLDYPDYEIILVDDHSTDRTATIADEWARRAEAAGRLRVIHNRELPAGWTGKTHAMNLGVRAASGEWILATDADLVFHPSILKLAISCALARAADFVSLVPEFDCGFFTAKVMMPAFSLLLSTLYPLRLVNDPKSPRAIAAGAFMLMRAAELRALGGYERLRNTLIEDVRMAELFKRNGRRSYLFPTRGLFRTRMYQDTRELWEGLSRSAFEGAGYSIVKVLAGVGFGMLLGVFPWAAGVALAIRDAASLRHAGADLGLMLALAACVLSALVYLPVLVFLRVSPFYVFTQPLAAIFYSAIALNSMLRSVFGEGVSWKGRRYSSPSSGGSSRTISRE